jgi:hypothetical protein
MVAMSTSPHKNWKGCAMCKAHKIRGQGRRQRDPFRVARKLGAGRRFNRKSIGDQG